MKDKILIHRISLSVIAAVLRQKNVNWNLIHKLHRWKKGEKKAFLCV